eukprot:11112384-Karenia_brevis.AAC.1
MTMTTTKTGGVMPKKTPEGPKIGSKKTNGYLSNLPKHTLIKDKSKDMRHKGKLPQLRGSKTANNMIAHVGKSRITITPDRPAPPWDVQQGKQHQMHGQHA